MYNVTTENTITKNLLDSQHSDHKQVVECEINGWLQTNKKEKKEKKCFVIKLKPSSTQLFHKETQKQQKEPERQKQQKKTQKQQKQPLKQQKQLQKCQKYRKQNLSMVFEENKENEETQNILKNNSVNISIMKNHFIIDLSAKEHYLQEKSISKSNKSAYLLKELRRKKLQKNHLKLFLYNNSRFGSKSELQKVSKAVNPIESPASSILQNYQKRLSLKSCRPEVKRSQL